MVDSKLNPKKLKYDPEKLPTVGVIGGFGPQSSAVFLRLIFDNFAKVGASATPHFPNVLFENIRTAGVFGGAEDGFVDKKRTRKDVGKTIIRLEKNGADFIVIPCNSIFGIFKSLKEYSYTEIIHIADAVLDKIKKRKVKTTLLLGTTTTTKKRNDVYYSRFKKAEIKLILPNQKEQGRIDSIITNVFMNNLIQTDKKFLVELINKYQKQESINGVILGCTELPLLLEGVSIKLSLLDSLKIYADYITSFCFKAQDNLLYPLDKIYIDYKLQEKFVKSKKPKSIENFFKGENKFLINNIPENSVVLDAGCGWGRHLELISSKISQGIGIDTNTNLIRKSKKHLRNCNNINTFYSNIYNIPFPEAYFDVVICMNNTLGNLHKQSLAIKEMIRVLKPKGKLFISVHSEGMIKDKINWYKKIGLKKPKLKNGTVVTDEGFYSYCYNKSTLKKLFERFGIRYSINNITPESFICELRK